MLAALTETFVKQIVLRMFRFIEWYQQKLEPASLYMECTGAMNLNVSELLGAHKDYYVILDHYEMLLKTKCNDTLEQLIAENFPLLSSGLAGSALHGLIHLGYGYSARNSRFQPYFFMSKVFSLYIILDIKY